VADLGGDGVEGVPWVGARCSGGPLPDQAVCSIDLWTGCIAGGQPVDGWCELLDAAGFTDISVGPAADAFGGSGGEKNARAFDVFAHVFLATKPV
jgi:hypothetical protein